MSLQQQGPLTGSIIWVQRLCSATGSSDWVQRLGPATGSSDWVQRLGPATGSSDWVQQLGPATGSSNWVQRLGPYLKSKQSLYTFNCVYVIVFKVSQWLGTVPTILFSFFAGSLSDDYGRKPLMFWPMIGNIIGIVLWIINYAFINELPIEFLYLPDFFWNFFGGSPIYYLGVYGYGASISEPKDRVELLARFDSLDLIGVVLGSTIAKSLLMLFKTRILLF
jgi:MFS family permease